VKPVLLDTGVIVALLDRSERFHERSKDAVEALGNSPLVTCEAVIAESCYLLRRISGAPQAVLDNVAQGHFQIPFELSRSAAEVLRLLHKYRDRPADFADVCLIHLAGQLRSGEILTLDRDFEIYRWSGNKRFRLLVPLD
jgi:predicted nucleic acid-binding protein